MHLIAPSLLSADMANLQRDVSMLNDSDADWFHFDVMDGVFVPNISFGLPVLRAVAKVASKPLDVHLMIQNPQNYIQEFVSAGASVISVHLEACVHLHRTLQQIKSTGAKAGIAINPHTPVSLLEPIIGMADLVCLMSVNPGFGGQKFIPESIRKIRQLKEMISMGGFSCLVEVDGGVDLNNARVLVEAGADVLVAGNAVFSAIDPVLTIQQLKKGF